MSGILESLATRLFSVILKGISELGLHQKRCSLGDNLANSSRHPLHQDFLD